MHSARQHTSPGSQQHPTLYVTGISSVTIMPTEIIMIANIYFMIFYFVQWATVYGKFWKIL